MHLNNQSFDFYLYEYIYVYLNIMLPKQTCVYIYVCVCVSDKKSIETLYGYSVCYRHEPSGWD